VDAYPETYLLYALEEFLDNAIYGPYEPAANYQGGFEATVAAIRVNESIMGDAPVAIAPEDFEI
jgi:hypothetical protein